MATRRFEYQVVIGDNPFTMLAYEAPVVSAPVTQGPSTTTVAEIRAEVRRIRAWLLNAVRVTNGADIRLALATPYDERYRFLGDNLRLDLRLGNLDVSYTVEPNLSMTISNRPAFSLPVGVYLYTLTRLERLMNMREGFLT